MNDLDDLRGRGEVPRCEDCGHPCLGPLINGRITCGCAAPEEEETDG